MHEAAHPVDYRSGAKTTESTVGTWFCVDLWRCRLDSPTQGRDFEGADIANRNWRARQSTGFDLFFRSPPAHDGTDSPFLVLLTAAVTSVVTDGRWRIGKDKNLIVDYL